MVAIDDILERFHKKENRVSLEIEDGIICLFVVHERATWNTVGICLGDNLIFNVMLYENELCIKLQRYFAYDIPSLFINRHGVMPMDFPVEMLNNIVIGEGYEHTLVIVQVEGETGRVVAISWFIIKKNTLEKLVERLDEAVLNSLSRGPVNIELNEGKGELLFKSRCLLRDEVDLFADDLVMEHNF